MSNLVEHAKRELALLNNDEDFNATIVAAVEAFASYGHSGGSASYAIPLLNDLLQFKPLSALTNNPKEWNEVGEGVWQNSRHSEAFSTDHGMTYYLVSEMTPYYESESYEEPQQGDSEPDPVPEPSSTPGDTTMAVDVVSDADRS